jgi:hypothetical protein
MHGNTGILGERLRQLRSGVSDEVDVDAASQCAGVVLHPRTSAEISDDDDSGAHA